jgi:hypothetical protein
MPVRDEEESSFEITPGFTFQFGLLLAVELRQEANLSGLRLLICKMGLIIPASWQAVLTCGPHPINGCCYY